MKKHLLLMLTFLVCLSATSQSWEDTVARIENIFSRYKPDRPGAELAIGRNGKTIFSKAWGMADLEHNSPLTTGSITEAGSVSKQFTAAAILLLEQQGKLSLDDDVRKYVPELRDYGYPITLRHMMQHKSGLKDWGAIAAIAGWPRGTKAYNNDDALYIISNQKTLNHKPGDEYLYSNSNYNLFAIIVQRVSGMSLAEFTRQNIFEPAGMKHTQWRDDYRRIVPNRAIAYSRSGSGHQTNMPSEYVYGNGGLLTTAEDLLTWCNFYLAGKLGNPSLLNKQITTTAFNNGVMHRYAGGLFVGTYRGWQYYSHDGATAGYRANLDVFPELGLSIAWLSNTSEFDNDTLNVADAIAELFVPAKVPDRPQDPPRAVTLSFDKLKGHTGWYRNSRTGGGVKISLQNEKLFATQVGELTPISDNIFASGNNRIVMNQVGFLFINAAKDSIYFTSVEEAKPDENAMSEYAGEYYSDEAEAKCHVVIKNGKIFIQQKPKAEWPLSPTYKDGFESPAGIIYFERVNRKINSLKVSIARARNVEFKKIK
ncbi:MAG TPA: serine hydrolase domain-containing protein [Chitinophagaceae bacterium]|nr:serine hydrolase domain-containing protein [Chitinophagaceae bacterium]